MSHLLSRLVMIALLLMAIIAPFAGLAPLMLVLLVLGVGYALLSLLQTLVLGSDHRKSDPGKSDSNRPVNSG